MALPTSPLTVERPTLALAKPLVMFLVVFKAKSMLQCTFRPVVRLRE